VKAPHPQPILASFSDELYDPFSEEARILPPKHHMQFDPALCPIDGVHLTRDRTEDSARAKKRSPDFLSEIRAVIWQ